jgi:hypothetical protein
MNKHNSTEKIYADESLKSRRAFNHPWKFINRKQLNDKQIKIIQNLGCYKPSRTELGTRYTPPTS